MARATAIEVTPLSGGALVTRASSENAGAFNYRIKRDWRRVLDGELRREGRSYLWPNFAIPLGAQSLNSFHPINLITTAWGSNGRTAVIAGSKGTLYRYFALESPGYYGGDTGGPYYTPTGPSTPYMALVGADTPYYDDASSPDPYMAATGDDTPYYVENEGYWLEIGSGFSEDGRRWEAVQCGDYLIFNNGVDLPVSYSLVDYQRVVPLYELRELGVARVGTIAEVNGVLVCMDVTMIKDGLLEGHFTDNPGNAYGVITAAITVRIQNRVLWSDPADARRFAASFPASMTAGSRVVTLNYPVSSLEAGQEITILGAGLNGGNLTTTILNYPGAGSGTYASGVLTSTGVNVSNGDTVTVGGKTYTFQTVLTNVDGNVFIGASASASLTNLVAAINLDTGSGTLYAAATTANTGVRAIRLADGTALRATALAAGTAGNSIASTEAAVTLSWAAATLLGGAAPGTPNILMVADAALTTVEDVLIARSDTAGSLSGYDDLINDGSAILKGLKLDGVLIIYRDTGTQVATFTGNTVQPFDFSALRASGDAGLYYRNTLASVTWNERTFHVFAGRNAIYRYDMATRTPVVLGLFTVAKDLFFDHARIGDDDDVYSSVNSITHEVFFWLPDSVADTVLDRAIAFDYEHNTLGTTADGMVASATVKRPNVGQGEISQTEDWFVMAGGLHGGELFLYGRTDQPNLQWGGATGIWNRCGEAYDSLLRSGLSNFGDRMNEKEVSEYVLFLASVTPEAQVRVKLYGAQNPVEAPALLGNVLLETPKMWQNLIPTHFKRFHFADEIIVSGMDNPCTIAARTWNVSGVRSQSFSRRPA